MVAVSALYHTVLSLDNDIMTIWTDGYLDLLILFDFLWPSFYAPGSLACVVYDSIESIDTPCLSVANLLLDSAVYLP